MGIKTTENNIRERQGQKWGSKRNKITFEVGKVSNGDQNNTK